MELIADILNDIPWLFEETHSPGCIAGVMEGNLVLIIAARIQVQFAVFDQIRGKLTNVNHFVGFGVLKHGTGERRFWHLKEVGRA